MDSYTLNPLTDTLTARHATRGRVFLVLNGEDAWDVANDPKGRSPGELLAMAWRVGEIDDTRWTEDADETPQFTHDCDACEFLGRVDVDGRKADAWVDHHNGRVGLIARYGSHGPEYCSMPAKFYANADGIQGATYALWRESLATA